MKTLIRLVCILAIVVLTGILHQCYGQINSAFKGAESLNADSTTMRNYLKADSMAGREAGWIYFNNQANPGKWRVGTWSTGQTPTWRDLINTTATGVLTLSNGLTKTGTVGKLGGALTANTSITGLFDMNFLGGGVFTVDTDNASGAINLLTDATTYILMSPGDISMSTTSGGTDYFFMDGTSGDSQWASSGNLSFSAPLGILRSLTKHTFTPSATKAAINLGSITGAPSVLSNSDLWYNDSGNDALQARIDGATMDLVTTTAFGATALVPFTSGTPATLTTNGRLGYDVATNIFSLENSALTEVGEFFNGSTVRLQNNAGTVRTDYGINTMSSSGGSYTAGTTNDFNIDAVSGIFDVDASFGDITTTGAGDALILQTTVGNTVIVGHTDLDLSSIVDDVDIFGGDDILMRATDDVDYSSTGGTINLNRTITAGGTTGNQTINKMAGCVNFAAAASTLTVTDSQVATTSIILGTIQTGDATATLKNIVAGSGSFVITLSAGATAETKVCFLVTN